jgi:O-antigen ligase
MSVLVLVLLLRERGTTRNSNGYLTVLLAIGLVLLIAVGLFLGWENFLQLGSTLLDFMIKKRATSIMRRLTQIEFAWRVLTSTPQSLLFGQGYGRFEDLFARAYPDAASFFLHNHYMGYFFGSGLLGLLSYGLLLLIALRDFYIVARKGQEPKCYWGAGLLAGFVGMLVVLAFFAKISNVKLLWLMIALAQKTRHFSTLQTGVKTHKGDRHHWGELEVS